MKAIDLQPAPKQIPNYLASRLAIYFRNSRVLDWRAYVGIASLGFFQNLEAIAPCNNLFEALKFTATIAFYLAFSFSINNCFDVDCDILREEKLVKNPVAAGLIGLKEGLIMSLCLAKIGLLLVFMWFGNCLPIYFALVLLAGAYSAPPLRLKSIPFLDLISHGLFFGSLLYLYGYGASAYGHLSHEAILIGTSIFVYSTTLELRNHLEDLQTDKSSGSRTTACWLGYEKARNLLKALLLAHWVFLMVVFVLVRFNLVAIFILLTALISLNFLELGSYVRFADLITCILYLIFLVANTNWPLFEV